MVSGFATLALFAASAMASVHQPRQIVSNSSSSSMTPSGTGSTMLSSSSSTMAASSSAAGSAASSTGSSAGSSSTSGTVSTFQNNGVSPAPGTTLTVGGRVWKYDGCAGSSSGYSTFSLAYVAASQTLESCLAAVPATSKYAGLFQGACYFATILDAATGVGSGVCNIKCSANSTEVCGGSAASMKRQASNAILLSLYEVVPAVTIGGTTNAAGTTINNINNGIQIGSINYVTQVYNYFAACGCAAGVTATALTTTLAYAACGCASQTVPTLPMTATTVVVNNATVTLTVPCTATATGSAVYYNGTCVGAGCPVVTVTRTLPVTAIGTGVPQASNGLVVVCNGVNCPVATSAAATGPVTVTGPATATVTAYQSVVTRTVTVANSACAASSGSNNNVPAASTGGNNVPATSATVIVVPVASTTRGVVTFTGAASKASGAFGALAVVGLAAMAL